MPIYEYVCSSCRGEFEKLVFSHTRVACSKCGSEDVKKKLSVCGFSGVAKPWAGTSSSNCSSCSKGSKGTCSSCG